MPDVFVATDKPKEEDIVMHKRKPLGSDSGQSQQKQPELLHPLPISHANVSEKNNETAVEPQKIEEKPQEKTRVVKELQREVPLIQKERVISAETKDQFVKAPIADKNPLPSAESSSEILVDDAERRNAIPLFTSFWQNPQGVYFDTQEANEHILLFLRRHFITNVPWLFTTILFLLLPLVVNYLVKATSFSLAIFPTPFVSASIFMYYLLVITAGFLRFLDWYFNISLITARRVMDIELKDLVYKKISATKIALVQDVNYKQAGTIRTIFNYGDILIQTAGATDNFFVNAVPRPEVVVQVMEALIGKGTEEKDNATL